MLHRHPDLLLVIVARRLPCDTVSQSLIKVEQKCLRLARVPWFWQLHKFKLALRLVLKTFGKLVQVDEALDGLDEVKSMKVGLDVGFATQVSFGLRCALEVLCDGFSRDVLRYLLNATDLLQLSRCEVINCIDRIKV